MLVVQLTFLIIFKLLSLVGLRPGYELVNGELDGGNE